MYRSRHTLRIKAVKSTQILTLPFCLDTDTLPAHQSVGSATFKITPVRYILFSSAVEEESVYA